MVLFITGNGTVEAEQKEDCAGRWDFCLGSLPQSDHLQMVHMRLLWAAGALTKCRFQAAPCSGLTIAQLI